MIDVAITTRNTVHQPIIQIVPFVMFDGYKKVN